MISIEELGIVFLAEISGFMKNGLKVPLNTLLRRAFYLLIAYCLFSLIQNETAVSILAAIFEFAASISSFLAKFI